MGGNRHPACRVGRTAEAIIQHPNARTALQTALTLSVVLVLYGAPLILTVILGLFRQAPAGRVDVVGEREPVTVFWEAPAPPAPEDGEPAAEPEATADPEPTPADEAVTDAVPEPEPEPDAGVADLDAAGADATPRKQRRVRRRPSRRRVSARPPRPLTKSEQRKRDKRKRKRARQARRKQCAELVDQVVQVSDDEWWFGREIVNCFRTHFEQFDRLGGAYWATDDRGDRIGIRLSVSRRAEVARLAGWRSGDVVVSVNGIRMRSWGGVGLAATQIYRGRAKVKRIRDGEVEVVRFRVKSVAEVQQKRLEMAAAADVGGVVPDGD